MVAGIDQSTLDPRLRPGPHDARLPGDDLPSRLQHEPAGAAQSASLPASASRADGPEVAAAGHPSHAPLRGSHGPHLTATPEVETRTIAGHWEGDLIVGADGRSAIATLVERSSRYLLLVHLDRDRSAAGVRKALVATMRALPPSLRRSLTWDQGAEMSEHHAFTKATNAAV
jgi:hypothetical protein